MPRLCRERCSERRNGEHASSPEEKFAISAVTDSAPAKPTIAKPGLTKRLLRVREAAEYLSISPWKVRRLIQQGLLPVVQASESGAWRVDVRDLDAFIERNKRTELL